MRLTLNTTKKLPDKLIEEYDLQEDIWDEDEDIDYSVEIESEYPNALTDTEMKEVGSFIRNWDEKYGELYGRFSTGEAWFDKECQKAL